ncbi:hypothetical protein F5Y09DRAFT_99292 [Xylaria sp. FL1042]|nr:hypothetical protein F5Y09DRAFT_99292 [Xylaria sp. FL1042]
MIQRKLLIFFFLEGSVCFHITGFHSLVEIPGNKLIYMKNTYYERNSNTKANSIYRVSVVVIVNSPQTGSHESIVVCF